MVKRCSVDVVRSESPQIRSMADIGAQDYPLLKYVVQDLIPEGLTLFAGKPKLGKSWLMLSVANAVAGGGTVLGKYRATEGRVLLLALEDSVRRLKRRNEMLMGKNVFPEKLMCATEWPKLNMGGLDHLNDFLEANKDTSLVVIDTFSIVRPVAKGNAQIYSEDYEAMRLLHILATEHNIAIIAVHHAKKGEAEDPYELMSGSTGLTGAADTLALLKRGRGEARGELIITGRDIGDKSLALDFDATTGNWSDVVDGADLSRTSEEREIIILLREAKLLMTCPRV